MSMSPARLAILPLSMLLIAPLVFAGCSSDVSQQDEGLEAEDSLRRCNNKNKNGRLCDAGSGQDASTQPGADGGVTDGAASGDTGVDGGGSSSSDAAGGGADSSTGGGGGSTDGGVDCRSAQLPGRIAGVEPESVANHAAMADSNGNLYRFTESPGSDGNRSKMMKSSDGGATWKEVDGANRPAASDLEGTYQLQMGSTIYLSINTGSRAWWIAFNTSDAPASPDRWVKSEEVASGYSKTSAQYSSLAHISGDRFWIFYSAKKDGNEHVYYRERTGVGTYGPIRSLETATGSWTGPRAIRGQDGTVYVLYQDMANRRLYARSLASNGTLSAATRVDQNGTSNVAVPHANPVLYQRDGRDELAVAFAGGDNYLKLVTIREGKVSAEEPVSSAVVLQDAPTVTNEGVVASLALDGSTLHAAWTDKSTGQIMHRSRSSAGSWSGTNSIWASSGKSAWYVYCAVVSGSGCRRLGCTYDIGPHADDTGDIEYSEMLLGSTP